MPSRRLRLLLLASAFSLPAGLAGAASFDIVSGTNTTNQTLTGNETGVVEAGATLAPNGAPVTVNGTATGVILTNSGTVASANGDRGVDIATGAGALTVTVNNNAGATITSVSDAVRLNQVTTSGAVIINNSGLIDSTGEQAIDFRADTKAGATVQINNLAGGVIRSEGAEGIAVRGGTITNLAGATITGATTSIQVDNGAGGAAAAATTLTNDGTIRGLNGSGVVLVGAFGDTVTNTGAIRAIGGTGLSTGQGADTVTNSGSITTTGSTAIDLGAGVDSLTLQTGSIITGLIDGGSELDTLILQKAGSAARGTIGSTANVEILDVQSGTWTLSETQSYANGATLGNGSALVNNGAFSSTKDTTIRLVDPLVDRVTITNNASITNNQTDGRAINITPIAAVENLTINNNAGAEISAQNDAIRIGIAPIGGSIIVNNSGTIRTTGNGALSNGGQAIDFDLSTGLAAIQINNQATGQILSVGQDAIRPGARAAITNAGLIRSDINITAGYNSIDGIDWQNRVGTVDNQATGVISGVRHGVTAAIDLNVTNEAGGTIIGRNGSGVGSDGTGTVVNAGTITGAVDLSYTSGDGLNGDGDGVDIDGLANIDNSGTIQGTGARGVDSGGRPNASEGIAVGGGTITNRLGGVISGVNSGILVDDGAGGAGVGATILINDGTIRGLAGSGVTLVGSFDDAITNSGAIAATGGSAIDMGAGNDSLVLTSTSNITGLIDGGVGTDRITLQTSVGAPAASFAGAVNFETLDVQSGIWTLSGTQAYSGGTTIRNGATATVNSALGGPLAVLAGGRLNGSGALGAVTVRGTIAPGNSIGTTNVDSIAFTNSATYEVEVNATQSDLIAATGGATLAGTVQVQPQAGATYDLINTYTILTAGSTAGTFSGVTSDLAFLTPELSYTATKVNLVLRRNDVQFADVAVSPNQRRVGMAITAAGVANPLYQALLPLGVADTNTSLDLLSGDLHPSALSAAIEASQVARGTVLSRLSREGAGAWITAFDRGGSIDADSGRAKAEQNRYGVMFGGDLITGGWRLGVEAGLSNGELKLPGRAAKADIDGVQFGAYAGAEINGFHVKLGALTGGYDLKTTRSLFTTTLSQTLTAGYTVHTSQAFGEVGMSAGPFQPFAGLALNRIKAAAFTEAGGSAGVASGQREETVAYSTLGARYSGMVGAAAVHGEAAWRHSFNTDESSSLTFISGGPAFTVDGSRQDADVGLFKLGVDFGLGGPAHISLDGDLQAGSGSRAYGVSATFDWRF